MWILNSICYTRLHFQSCGGSLRLA
ncbi:Uncharacterized protein APZ42_019509 [Daphnia magna]|uniref:Uncharacterized protein n=1 Tax=Daphnia magna TaxID=35525 RepID=A0A164Y7X9_9CRUS|nr:Uncharacterized protein APZ42_019509 [Daphnia magna]